MHKIEDYIRNSIETKEKMLEQKEIVANIEKIANLIVKSLKDGGKLLFVGNGGSASDCDHLATEFVSRFYQERSAYNAISLTSNNALITALSNDFSYEKAFSRQIEAIANEKDIVFALSTSGNSLNVIKALEMARAMNLKTVGLTGMEPSKMDEHCDILIKIPSKETPIIQESQMTIGHLICKLVEDELEK